MRKRRYMNPAPLFALAGLTVLSSAAFAQQLRLDSSGAPGAAPIPDSPSAAAAAQEGGSQSGGITLKLMGMLVSVHPSVKADLRYDDNVYQASNNRTADQILVLTPALRLETRLGTHTYSLRLSSTIGQYQKQSADNYTNTTLNGLADLDLGTSLRARVQADYTDGVDPRGSTNNPLAATPDHYREIHGQGTVSYGASGARGRLDFELGRLQREYLNNRATTAASDRTVDNLGTTFHWRIGPKTTLLFQGKHSIIDYASAGSNLDSVENALLAGASWDATARTKGTFRIGMTKKDFDDSTRNSSTSVSWSGQVRWSPRTYSHVDLNFNRAPAETTGGVGDYIVKSLPSVTWTHEWNSRLSSTATASYVTDAYQGAPRTDNTQSYAFKATYKMRRWLSFGGDYAHSVRDSDSSNFDYQRNVFMLFLHAAL